MTPNRIVGGIDAYPAKGHRVSPHLWFHPCTSSPQETCMTGSSGAGPTSTTSGSPKLNTGSNDWDFISLAAAQVRDTTTSNANSPRNRDSPRNILAASRSSGTSLVQSLDHVRQQWYCMSGISDIGPTSTKSGSPQPTTCSSDQEFKSCPAAGVRDITTLDENSKRNMDSIRDPVYPEKVVVYASESVSRSDSSKDFPKPDDQNAPSEGPSQGSYPCQAGPGYQDCRLTRNERVDHDLAVSATLAALETFVAWLWDTLEAMSATNTTDVSSEISVEFSRICRLVAFHTSLAEHAVSQHLWLVIVKALYGGHANVETLR